MPPQLSRAHPRLGKLILDMKHLSPRMARPRHLLHVLKLILSVERGRLVVRLEPHGALVALLRKPHLQHVDLVEARGRKELLVLDKVVARVARPEERVAAGAQEAKHLRKEVWVVVDKELGSRWLGGEEVCEEPRFGERGPRGEELLFADADCYAVALYHGRCRGWWWWCCGRGERFKGWRGLEG